MEHSTKMTLVPTTEAELTQLSELDSELTNILKNKELNQDDKIKLYTNVLGKYKKFEEKVYPNENFNPDNQDNFKTPTKQKLFPKNVLLKKKIGKPVLLYTGSLLIMCFSLFSGISLFVFHKFCHLISFNFVINKIYYKNVFKI
jgi:hypothetical protein